MLGKKMIAGCLLLVFLSACSPAPDAINPQKDLSKQESVARQSIAVENAKQFVKDLGWKLTGASCVAPDKSTHVWVSCTVGLPNYTTIALHCQTTGFFRGSCQQDEAVSRSDRSQLSASDFSAANDFGKPGITSDGSPGIKVAPNVVIDSSAQAKPGF